MREYTPPGSASVLEMRLPLARVEAASLILPGTTFAEEPVRLITTETSPVGVPVPLCGATAIVRLAGEPCTIGNAVEDVRVVALAVPRVTPAVFHFAIRFATLTEPSPDARS